jgi:hypothetical protein
MGIQIHSKDTPLILLSVVRFAIVAAASKSRTNAGEIVEKAMAGVEIIRCTTSGGLGLWRRRVKCVKREKRCGKYKTFSLHLSWAVF